MQIRCVLPLAAALASVTSTAQAATQVWPFQFDPNLAPDASGTQALLAQGATSLPPLPLGELQTLTTDNGSMTLWFFPENAALLTGIQNAGPDPMSWPSTPVICAQHAAFALPSLLVAGAGAACQATAAQIQQALSPATLQACILTEQPELYVHGYSPSNVASDVGNIEDMIGLAGEALTHAGLPLQGILPADWVPTMRTIVDKIRYSKLLPQLQQASSAYSSVSGLLGANASCFDPTAAGTLQTELTALSGEVSKATTYLQDLEKQGEGANAQTNVCLAAHARTRLTLPYPGLTDAERTFVGFWLGATYWRMRGGGLIPLGSTQEARLYYVENGFGQIGNLLGGSDGQSVGVPFFTELILDGWGPIQSMGTDPTGNDKYTDLILMTERGQRQAQAGIGALPAGYDTHDLMTGGLQMGPGYYFAYYPLSAFRYGITMPSPYSNFIDWPTAIGEFNIGGALGLGMAKVLLPGKATNQPPTVTLCTGRTCGDDGCGGSCGTCAAGLSCDGSGQCVDGPTDAGAADAASNKDATSGSGSGGGSGSSSGAGGGSGGSSGSGSGSSSGGGSGSSSGGISGGSGGEIDSSVGAGNDASNGEAPGSASSGGGCGCGVATSASGIPVVASLGLLGIAGLRRRLGRRTRRT